MREEVEAVKRSVIGTVAGHVLALTACLIAQPSAAVASDSFGRIAFVADDYPTGIWLSDQGYSYIQRALTNVPRGDGEVRVVQYRFQLSQDEVRRISEYLRTHKFWRTKCATISFDDVSWTIWQRSRAVTRATCMAGNPASPDPGFEAAERLLYSVEGGQKPAIEIYRGPDTYWTPPGFENPPYARVEGPPPIK